MQIYGMSIQLRLIYPRPRAPIPIQLLSIFHRIQVTSNERNEQSHPYPVEPKLVTRTASTWN